MNISLKLTGIAILFVFIIVSGIWMAKAGKPYSPVLFNIHKLISLAAIVLGGIWIYSLMKGTPAGTGLIILLVAAILLYIMLLISGGMLNLDKSFEQVLRIIHKVASPLAIGVTIVLFYLLLKK